MHRFFIPKPYKQEMQITGRDAHHIMDVHQLCGGDYGCQYKYSDGFGKRNPAGDP